MPTRAGSRAHRNRLWSMRSCTDILPVRVLDDVQAVVDDPSLVQSIANQTSYAEAARVLRALCVERLKA